MAGKSAYLGGGYGREVSLHWRWLWQGSKPTLELVMAEK